MAKKKTGKKKSARPSKSWQARLTARADDATAEFLSSLDADRTLWRYDIAGSIAHAQMLSEVGILKKKEFARIKKGLLSISEDLRTGRLETPVELEDIHMVIEKALIDRVGQAGGKLHTGRSRNDQVALDLRLWARDAADDLVESVRSLQRAFVELARKYKDLIIPAYTHLQRAQPALAGHVLLAYVEMLQRDAERLIDARRRIDVCPLGSGAVAGTSLPLNRKRTAELLGFAQVSRNSIDATSGRDFLAELCFDCAMIGVHLSRWAEDWIIYCSQEFAMMEIHDSYCTSSSMMPQKKNPDTLELIRGKSASGISNLVGMLTLMKSLPLAYNRDLQDDKRYAFSAVATVERALTIAEGIVKTAGFNTHAVAGTIQAGYMDATSLAEYLVGKGVAFRKAHQIVGRLVLRAEKLNKPLCELPLETLQEVCDKIVGDVYDYLGAENIVKHYRPEGSSGKRQLRSQLAYWERELR